MRSQITNYNCSFHSNSSKCSRPRRTRSQAHIVYVPRSSRTRRRSRSKKKGRKADALRPFFLLLRAHEESNITCSVPVLDILYRKLTKYLKTVSIPQPIHQKNQPWRLIFLMYAGPRGIEPRPLVLETSILPLNYRPV